MDTKAESLTQKRPRILFVDDSRVMRVCAQKILGDQFDLVACDSAESAWELLSSEPSYQLLFTDLQMPGRSGFDLLRDIRESDLPEISELPVVLITGAEDREEKRRQALDLGATDFITKPFNAPELLARARAYSDSVESRRRLRLLERSHHLDQATGLGNRGYCEKRLKQAISFTSRHGQALTLMHLQLSGLAGLLEEMGNEFASHALKRIGKTLAARIRCEDSVFRTGPESFTFLLPATLPAGAEALQARFLPDLEALGLCTPGDLLRVSGRFIIQPVPLDSPGDAAKLLEAGLADRISENLATATEAGNGAAALDLEEALRMLERGDGERIRPHLGQIRERLQPLLAMLAERTSSPLPHADGDR